ncbi:MAG: restriction endonuclease, partial [Rhodanobacter sp.]
LDRREAPAHKEKATVSTNRKGYRRRSKPVHERYSDALAQVSWQDFERLMVAYYAGQGYRVEHAGTAGSGTKFDGGIDLKLYRDDQYIVVQCKHWNAWQVTHNPVHELLGVMLTQRATGAIVVTSGEFTRAAHEAASKESRIQLIDGPVLRQMLGPLVDTFAPRPNDDADFSNFGDPIAVDSPASYRPRRTRRTRVRNPLPGMVFAIIAGLIALYAIHNVLDGLAVKTHPQPTALRPAIQQPIAPIRHLRASPPVSKPMQQRPNYIQGVPQTEAEMREWKRRNAESMKIIEKSTPQLMR